MIFVGKSLRWKRRLGKVYFLNYFTRHPRKIILIYHAAGNGPWAISADNFKKQVQWLKKHCDIVPLTTLLTESSKSNKIQVSLTFDDGYACLYDTVLPILQTEKALATVYVNTGWISECDNTRKDSNPNLGHYPGEKFLTWREVKALDHAGWKIGSHGVDHIDLTTQPSNIVHQELLNSKQIIESKLHKRCDHFAYTWGKHNAFIENLVLEAGYQYAVAGHHAIIKSSDNPFALPRMNVAIEYSLTDFENMLKGRWDFLGHIHRWKKQLKRDAA